MYNCFITGFKFIMFYHISVGQKRVQANELCIIVLLLVFKFIMFYHILFHLT